MSEMLGIMSDEEVESIMGSERNRTLRNKQIQAINQNGTAIVLVEQNAKKALAMSDRAYVLDTGVVKHEGIAIELLKDPKVIETYLGVGGH